MQQEGNVMTKVKVLVAISIVFLLISIGFFAYPSISKFYVKGAIEEDISNFDSNVSSAVDGITYEDALDKGLIDNEAYPVDKEGNRTSNEPIYYKADLDRLFKDSVEYNNNVKDNQYSLLVDESSYINPSIDLTNYGIFNGIYGYVTAPSIDMKVPIYLGANDWTMSVGSGHMTYTSLPIGGKGTNSVIVAHTGYTGKTFFDNLSYLNEGDSVFVTNFWDTLEYKVILKEVHSPSDSSRVFIEEDKDLLTLITCINGGKSRFYLICERC